MSSGPTRLRLAAAFVPLFALGLVSASTGAQAPAPTDPGDGTGALRDLEKGLRRVVELASPGVVTVIAAWPSRQEAGKRVEKSFSASGIVLDREGHVATPAEPLDDEVSVIVILGAPDGSRQHFRAKLLGKDPTHNVAVVKMLFPPEDLQPVPRGDPSSLAPGSIVVALASPYRYPLSCSWGLVSGLNRDIVVKGRVASNLIMTTTPMNPGDAGGALADARGRVVGMVMSAFDPSGPHSTSPPPSGPDPPPWRSAGNISFALPIDRVIGSAEAILAKQGTLEPPESRLRRFLGVYGSYLTEPNPVSSQLQLPLGTGFLVSELLEGELAQRSGVRPYDIIVRLGEVDIQGSEFALLTAIQKAPVNVDVPLVVIRGGKRLTLSVRFGDGDSRGKK